MWPIIFNCNDIKRRVIKFCFKRKSLSKASLITTNDWVSTENIETQADRSIVEIRLIQKYFAIKNEQNYGVSFKQLAPKRRNKLS